MSTLPSPSQQYGPNPTTPAFTDDTDWFRAYLEIHALSLASWRYAYIFWFAVGLVTLISTVFHLLGFRTGRLGAYWTKWSLRRRTWRKKHSLAQARKSGQPHKQPLLLPSNLQLLSLIALITTCLAVTFLGPDHIAPTSKVFGHLVARDEVAAYKPQYTIQKAWWTSGGRVGLMAFALFPLCVLFALKRPPFAIFAIPFLTRVHFDKFMWLHRWTGRFIWAMVTLHVALWSVQLANDTRSGTGKMAYVYAWHFQRFQFAWTAFILFTLLILLSSGPMREKHYDLFYALHVILVPSTIIMSALHHPPLWWWCWLALLLWAGERTWRATKWVYVNGFLGSLAVSTTSSGHRRLSTRGEDLEMRSATPDLEPIDFSADHEHYPRNLRRDSLPPYRSPDSKNSRHSHHRFTSSTTSFLTLLPTFTIPVGYGHAEILAGRTIRLSLITPGQITWAPGQHFLLCIPSVSRVVSHPFTCASVCDEQKLGDDGRTITFLIRAKNGWTKNLWTTVVSLLADGRQHPARESPGEIVLPSSGVLLRAWVDGPFGSPERTDWSLYSSAVVICGGSGVSFGVSVLEFLCLCMAGRDGRYLGGNVGKVSAIRRIRFIWILRDFAHMQWCASVLHRCRLLVPREALQLDLFVTNFNPSIPLGYNDTERSTSPDTLDPASSKVPPEGQGVSFDGDDESIDDQIPEDEFVDLSYYTGEYNETGEFGHEEHRLDLTNFDGENDDRLPGETSLNRTLKKEGTIRRALTRRTRVHRKGKYSLEKRPVSESRRPSDSATFNAETSHLLDSPVHPLRNSLDPSVDTSSRRKSSHRPASLSSVSIVPHTPPLGTPPLGTPPLGDWDTSGPRDQFTDGSLDWERKTISSAFSHASSQQPLVREAAKGVELEVGSQEMRDVSVMTEFARPGRPKIDSILKDEAGRTSGRVVVACCGPATLNAVVRKAVAAQINPSRIRQGDYGGSVDLVVEDFSY